MQCLTTPAACIAAIGAIDAALVFAVIDRNDSEKDSRGSNQCKSTAPRWNLFGIEEALIPDEKNLHR